MGFFVLANMPPGLAIADRVLFVSYPGATTSSQDYVATDRPYYVLGSGESAIVHITGHVSSQQPRVTVTVHTPVGRARPITWSTDPSGYFAIPYLLDFSARGGTYVVTVSYDGGQASASFVVMRS